MNEWVYGYKRRGIRSVKTCRPTQGHGAVQSEQCGTQTRSRTKRTHDEKRHLRVFALRCQRRALVAPELRHTDPASVHCHAQQRQLEFHASILEHPSPGHLDLAREWHLFRGRPAPLRVLSRCRTQDLRQPPKVLRGLWSVSIESD